MEPRATGLLLRGSTIPERKHCGVRMRLLGQVCYEEAAEASCIQVHAQARDLATKKKKKKKKKNETEAAAKGAFLYRERAREFQSWFQN